jgi:cytoskeletal protein RodZ
MSYEGSWEQEEKEFNTMRTVVITFMILFGICFIGGIIINFLHVCSDVMEGGSSSNNVASNKNRVPAYDPEAAFSNITRTANTTTSSHQGVDHNTSPLHQNPSITTTSSTIFATNVVQVTAPSSSYDDGTIMVAHPLSDVNGNEKGPVDI